jgi:hypothetical protein
MVSAAKGQLVMSEENVTAALLTSKNETGLDSGSGGSDNEILTRLRLMQ